MSAWTCRSSDGKADPKIVPPRPRIPRWKGPGADSEEKHEPAGDIDTAAADGLNALDAQRPIREADILKVIASSPTDVEPVLAAVVKAAVRFCGTTDAMILLRDGDSVMSRVHEGPLTYSWCRRTSRVCS